METGCTINRLRDPKGSPPCTCRSKWPEHLIMIIMIIMILIILITTTSTTTITTTTTTTEHLIIRNRRVKSDAPYRGPPELTIDGEGDLASPLGHPYYIYIYIQSYIYIYIYTYVYIYIYIYIYIHIKAALASHPLACL